MQYLAHWPEYFQVAESPTGEIMGYSKLLLLLIINVIIIPIIYAKRYKTQLFINLVTY